MYRQIQSEQILGSTFLHLIDNDQYEITLSKLYDIETQIDINIRARNQALVSMSNNSLHDTISNYADIFKSDDDLIELSDEIKEKIRQNKKDSIANMLYKYLIKGTPADICETINASLNVFLTDNI